MIFAVEIVAFCALYFISSRVAKQFAFTQTWFSQQFSLWLIQIQHNDPIHFNAIMNRTIFLSIKRNKMRNVNKEEQELRNNEVFETLITQQLDDMRSKKPNDEQIEAILNQMQQYYLSYNITPTEGFIQHLIQVSSNLTYYSPRSIFQIVQVFSNMLNNCYQSQQGTTLNVNDLDNLCTLGNQVLPYGQECPECVFNFYINLDNYINKHAKTTKLSIDIHKLSDFIDIVQSSLYSISDWRLYYRYLAVILPILPTDNAFSVLRVLISSQIDLPAEDIYLLPQLLCDSVHRNKSLKQTVFQIFKYNNEIKQYLYNRLFEMLRMEKFNWNTNERVGVQLLFLRFFQTFFEHFSTYQLINVIRTTVESLLMSVNSQIQSEALTTIAVCFVQIDDIDVLEDKYDVIHSLVQKMRYLDDLPECQEQFSVIIKRLQFMDVKRDVIDYLINHHLYRHFFISEETGFSY